MSTPASLTMDAEGTETLILRGADPLLPVMGQTVIELKDVSKIFETKQASVHALKSLDLSIRNKEFVCVLGPSGCGKSTILGMIAGLVRPNTGSVTIEDRSVDMARSSHRISPASRSRTAVLLPWRTVAENVSLPLEVLKLPRREREAKIKEVLELVKLDGSENPVSA